MPGSNRRHSHTPDAGSALALGATRDRRHSTSSDSAGGLSDGGGATGVRQFSNENIEYLPARLAKVTTSKPAANPLQFVKVRPCDLYRQAQEQIRRVEQVKKMKAEVRDEAEDWQSNLDNWKSSRRKRQEHIIERVVEVKKLEQQEECDRNRRKSKTFSEILEERRGRKLSLPMYQEEDGVDLSDLGISGSGSTTARRSYDFGDDDASSEASGATQNGHASPTPSADGGASVASSVASSEPAQEYTFEGAIQGYVDFAETRVRNGHASKPPSCALPKRAPPPPAKPRRDSAPEPGAPRAPAPSLPNVDVGKRRELFEKAAEKASPSTRPSRMPSAAASVRDRLSTLERQASANGDALPTTNGTPNGTPNGSANGTPNGTPNGSPKRRASRERLGNISPIKEVPFQGKLAGVESEEETPVALPPKPKREAVVKEEKEEKKKEKAKSNGQDVEGGEPRRQRQLHRSLDSLDVVPAGDLLSEAFERVQSLQALDRCGRGPLAAAGGGSSSELLAESSQSGDTDREDSGIHTADVSCSVSQADEPVCDEPAGDEPICDEPISVSEETATTVGSEVPPCPSPCPSPCPLLSPLSRDDDSSPALSPAPPATPEKLALPEALPLALPEPLTPEPVQLPQLEMQPAVEEPAEGVDIVVQASDDQEKDLIVLEEPAVEVKVVQPITAVAPATAPSPPEKPAEQEKAKKEEEKLPVPMPASPAAPLPLSLPPLTLEGDVEIVGGGLPGFPLGPPSSAEPPKEKPPPPPADLSGEEDAPPAESPLRRLDSTKRIKKEIRRKRSDFLGIDGSRDDDALEAALALAAPPPPDMATLLAEERRLQQQLFRRSLASDATDATDASTTTMGDSNDAAESRDSGVELERTTDSVDDTDTTSPEPLHAGDAHHRRDELFGHTSLTSEEEEVSRQEREIIANLEQEEQWRHNDNSIGEQLAERLRVLEFEKAEMERRRIEEEGIRREEERRLAAREAAIRMHEESEGGKSLLQDGDESGELSSESVSFQSSEDNPDEQPSLEDSANTGEALRREHARLEAQREQLREYEPPLLPSPIQQVPPPQHRWSTGPGLPAYGCRQPELSPPPGSPHRRPPPPAPPAKPQRVPSLEQQERVNSIRSSRVPSADCLAPPPALLQQQQQLQQQTAQQAHQMSRQTLQALSAAPRSRLITNDTWMQARRKQEPTNARPTLNNQHWLIQEAEHRRLTEQAQRCAPPPRRPPPPVQQQSPPWATQQPPPPPPPPRPESKPLPDSIIQTLTQRVQGRAALNDKRKAAGNGMSPIREPPPASLKQYASTMPTPNLPPPTLNGESQERMLSVSGKKKCSHCGEELGRGAAMIIESLRLFYHIDCFKCCVCHVQLGDGLMGTDVRVRNSKLHCHNCYSSEDGVKFSCV